MGKFYKHNGKIRFLQKFFWGLLFFVIAVPSFGQISITGTVSEAGGETMPGVNVVIKGSSVGTVTDINGKYTIYCAQRAGGIEVFVSGVYKPGNHGRGSEIYCLQAVELTAYF